MRVRTQILENRNAGEALERSARQYLLDGSQVGFNRARDEAPVGATGFLQGQAMLEPHVLSDGSVEWGNLADYARDVEQGTGPHWVPIRDLLRWARRKLGDESLAYPVQKSIAKHGTRPQPFIAKGIESMQAWFSFRGLNTYFEDNL